ncbi:P-loop NTPase fold protein [Pendulispora albinea]|uniref:KAP family NTPase n=1 Tax=Pendulispora albinea TaxID=2741071 RepID=A0ABZ2LVY2_9BACT
MNREEEAPQDIEEPDMYASLAAEHALVLARRLAASRSSGLTTAALFFGLAEAGRVEPEDTAARFLWRHLAGHVGEARYFIVRETFFPNATEALSADAPEPGAASEPAAVILQKAHELAVETSALQGVHLRHLLAALIVQAEIEPSAARGSDRAPGTARALFRELKLDVAQLKAEMSQWVMALEAPDDFAAWSRILAPSPSVEPANASAANTAKGPSIQRSTLSDSATREDSLGFRPTVRAVADFLRHRETKPPLTMSVEGEWGSGKSSFMMQLEAELKRTSESKGPTPFVVWFDAWRHADNEEMWATFAVEFLHQIAAQQTLFKRLWGHLLLFIRRVKWRDVRLEVLRAVLFGVAGVLIVLALVQLLHAHWAELAFARSLATEGSKGDGALEKLTGKLILAGGWTGALGLAVLTLTRVKGLVGGSLPFDLKKHVDSPDYEGRSTFLDQFHKDFAKIVDAYLGPRRVYVFIDDLDRCEVPTAVDLMQAINLMTACTPKLIFIIGMDREKVAAGVAAKYAPVLPYLRASSMPPGRGPCGKSSELDAAHGVAFGLDFIEKFIQLPFALPRPTEADTRLMLWNLSIDRVDTRSRRPTALPASSPAPAAQAAAATVERTAKSRDTLAPPSSVPVHTEQETARFASAVSTDSPLIHDITLALAPTLDFNPRRVKQFLNLFRLRAFLAWQTGRLELEHPGDDGDTLTLPQLGKLTAIALRWPSLVADLEADPLLLGRLQAFALGTGQADDGEHAPAAKWFQHPKLLALLRLGAVASQSVDSAKPAAPVMTPDYDVSRMLFAWSALGFSRMAPDGAPPTNGAASESPSPSIRVPAPASAQ